MEARRPHLTTQKSFYVEISRARDRAELVTDDAAELRAQLQAVTGERIAALEGIGEMAREAPGKAGVAVGPERKTPEAGRGKGKRAGSGWPSAGVEGCGGAGARTGRGDRSRPAAARAAAAVGRGAMCYSLPPDCQ